MALFFPEDRHHERENGRLVGFDRYRQLLERHFLAYMLGGFVTLILFLPLVGGLFYAFLSSSLLAALAAGLAGGAVAGVGLYALYDLLYRSFRNAADDWWRSYKRALRSAIPAALPAGAVMGLFWAAAFFMGCLLFWWGAVRPTGGTVAVYLAGMVLFTMISNVFWPQLVLFTQRPGVQLRNCLLFCIKYFWRVLGVSLLQLAYWGIMLLFLPWTLVVQPLLSLWAVLFVSSFLLYRDMNAAFQIEARIQEAFPGQILPDEEDL